MSGQITIERSFDILRREFAHSRDRAKAAARYGEAPPLTCRYCGLYWRPWAGSKLDGHAKCYVTDEFKRTLRDFINHREMTFKAVARELGVTDSIIRSWTFPIRGTAP